MELGPAEDGGHSTANQHRVEENESANGGVRVLAEDHKSNEPDGRTSQPQLSRSVVCQGNACNAEKGIEGTHKGIVDIVRVLLSRFELERSIVSSQDSGEANKHLAEGRVDVEVVFMFDVVASELAKTGVTEVSKGFKSNVNPAPTELHPK